MDYLKQPARYEILQDSEKKEEIMVLYEAFYPNHFHKREEFTYMVNGNMTCAINGVHYSVEKDDILFVPPWNIHSYFDSKNAERFVITPTDKNTSSSCLGNNLHPPFLLTNKEFNRSQIYPVLQNIYSVSSSDIPQHAKDLQLHGLFILLYGKMFQAYEHSFNKISINKQTTTLSNILNYIENNYSNRITLDDIAKNALINKFSVSKLFSHYMGVNINTYINDLRIKKFLNIYTENPDKNYTSIIFEVGFNTTSSFYRAFKKKYNVSPTEFLLQS